MSEPIELVQGPDGVFVEGPAAARPKKRKRPAAARPPAPDPAAQLETAEPHLRVDVLALGALDVLLGGQPIYHAALRPSAARVIARTLSPARIERQLSRWEKKLCR